MFLDRAIPYQPSMIKVAQIQTTFLVVSHEQRCTPNVIETTGNIFYYGKNQVLIPNPQIHINAVSLQMCISLYALCTMISYL